MLSNARKDRDRRLRESLEGLYATYGAGETHRDPVALVRRYASPQDREVAGWIASSFAYGRVETILENAGALLAALGESPARALASRTYSPADLSFFRHRFHGPEEAAALLGVIGGILAREGSVGAYFRRHRGPDDPDVGPMLDRVSGEILSRFERPGTALKFLFPRPSDGSACKRWNLYLRWMCRSDAVDFGIWRWLPTRALIMPTDTHVHRVARRLSLTRRKTADWTTAVEITRRLARLDPDDPVKYDFALCRLGILEVCRVEPRLSECPRCAARAVCPVGRRRAA